jgi:hypothetical protein
VVDRIAGYSGFDTHDLIQVPPHRRCSLGTRAIHSVGLLEQTIRPASLTKLQALSMSPCCSIAAGAMVWAAAWSAACTQGAVTVELWAQDPRPVMLRGFKVQRPGCFFAVSRC